MQASQYVAVRPALAVQIWTPGTLPDAVQRRTSCSKQGQAALMLSFQAHSRGAMGRQVALAATAHKGMLVLHCARPEQATPPQRGGVPTIPADLQLATSRPIEAKNRSWTILRLSERGSGFGIGC